VPACTRHARYDPAAVGSHFRCRVRCLPRAAMSTGCRGCLRRTRAYFIAYGRHERSNALYRQAVEREPTEARFWYNLASSERSFGRLVEAETACDRAIALDSTQYASYLLRSELLVQSPEANHVGQLQSRLSRPNLPDRARVSLGYALAKSSMTLSDSMKHFTGSRKLQVRGVDSSPMT
jgi:tetratricopeptide (TPR) repeat protein